MIEVDVDPHLGRCADGTLRDLLRSLQHDAHGSPDLWSADPVSAVSVMAAEDIDAYGSVETIQVVQADLPQLRSELEFELRRLIERLLAVM
jgi:hypothetical protein